MRAESDKVRPRRSAISQREHTQDTRARPERAQRSERAERPRPAQHARSPAGERTRLPLSDELFDRSPDDTGDKRKPRSFSFERSDEDGIAPSVKLPEFKGGGDSGGASSSDSSESGGSLLCSLAPKWLSQGRARRAARRREHARAAPEPAPPVPPVQQPPGICQPDWLYTKLCSIEWVHTTPQTPQALNSKQKCLHKLTTNTVQTYNTIFTLLIGTREVA